MGLGGIAIVAVVVTIVLFAALRTTRRATLASEPAAHRRTATIPELTARAGLAPPATNGIRMALDCGRRRTAVPTRSALLGGVLGVVGVTAALVFASSLRQVVDTPQRYGWTWNFTASDSTANTPCGGDDDFGFAQLPDIEEAAELCYNPALQVDGRTVPVMAFTPLRGTITPEIIEGRAPSGPREIALGSTTVQAAGKNVGDQVRVASTNGATLDYEVVGRVVLPPIGLGQPLADGAVLTGAGNAPLFDLNNYYRYFVGRLASGADRAALMQSIAADPRLEQATTAILPAELDHFRQISWIPVTLAAILGGLGLLAVGHALVVSIRQRRREFAVLKTIGFTRRQVRATVAWQATTIATVALVIGIPTGLIIGKLVWRAVANSLGIATITTIPTIELLVMIPAAVAVVGLIAFFPARAAAHMRPAVALRSE
jgi:hypothetical protein